MVQIDVPVAFGIGTLFADAAYRQLQTGQALPFYRTLVLNEYLPAFFFVGSPSILCSTISAGRRPTCGGTRTLSRPIHSTPPSSSWSFSQQPTGDFYGESVGQAGAPGHQPSRVLLRMLIYSAVWILAQTNSTFRLGTYAEWKRGEAPWFYQDPTFLAMLIFTLLVWGAGLAIFFVRLRRGGNEMSV